MIKILFLDIDGVLAVNSKYFEQYAVDNLKDIINQTNCKIVLSSSWRLASDWKNNLKQSNPDKDFSWIDSIIDTTVYGINDSRCFEIKHWLKNNPCDRFVVVDDMQIPIANLVKTKTRVGLDNLIKQRIIAILNY